MGTVFTSAYNKARRIAQRYNFNHRALKHIEKGINKAAPRHPFPVDLKKLTDDPLLAKKLEDLNKKDPQLDEYLKKVYLTSTSEIKAVAKPRPLPVATSLQPMKTMFYEPETTPEGSCTLSEITTAITQCCTDPQKWNPTNLSKHYKVDKKDMVNLVTYYSLFQKDVFSSLNQEAPSEEAPIKFEVYNKLEKKPLKQIEGKK